MSGVYRDVRVPTADPSITLGADLFLPDVAGPVPLIVMVLPYRKDLGGADLLLGYFARQGYAGMIVDVRGTGSSDGTARPAFSDDEAQDAVDAITWGASQPWCNGKVGMFGHSYDAMLAMRAAARRPSALRAIIPVQGMVDPVADFVHPDGARGNFGPCIWIAGMLGNFLLPPCARPVTTLSRLGGAPAWTTPTPTCSSSHLTDRVTQPGTIALSTRRPSTCRHSASPVGETSSPTPRCGRSKPCAAPSVWSRDRGCTCSQLSRSKARSTSWGCAPRGGTVG